MECVGGLGERGGTGGSRRRERTRLPAKQGAQPDAGLDPRTARSSSEPKTDA